MLARWSLLAVVMGSLTAWPCRGPFRSLEENVASARVIAVVEFESSVELETPPRTVGKLVELTFTVKTSLKGDVSGRLTVRSDTSTCGFGRQLSRGDRLLLFASGTPLGTGATSGNLRLGGEAGEAELLEQVKALARRPSTPPPPPPAR